MCFKLSEDLKILLSYEGKDETVIIPNSVTEILSGAFKENHNVRSVILPPSVKKISRQAFEDCELLEHITMSNVPNECDGCSFCGCQNLKNTIIRNGTLIKVLCSIQGVYCIPQGITEIATGAFCNCKEITEVIIPEGVRVIKSAAFVNIPSLRTIHIPASVESIDERSFEGCGEIESITVDEGNLKYDSRNQCNAIVETETNKIVRGCVNTKFVENIKSIGSYAFSGCKNLKKIDIPNTIIRIGYEAFNDCSLKTIHIPASVESIDEHSFEGCGEIESITVDEGNLKYDSRNQCNAIVETETNKIVRGCVNTKFVENIKIIGSYAFSGCKDLGKFDIPNTIVRIDSYAFKDCSLKTIHIPASVESIDERGFKGCGEIESITVDEGNLKYDSRNQCNAIVETETNKIVRGCVNTKFVENIKIIGSYAFSGCKDLKKIDIPNTIVRVGSSAFSNCENLCNVIISEGVKHIDADAFWGCNQIKTLKIPESYEPDLEEEKRSWCSFNGLASLETPVYNSRYFVALPQNFVGKYVVPDGIVEICSFAFEDCAALTEVSLPDSVRTISYGAFAECHALQKVINASKIEKIGKYAFDECEKLLEINLQNASSIGEGAFEGCSLRTIHIPASVESIDERSFEGCGEIESITVDEGNLKYDSRNQCNAIVETETNKIVRGCVNTKFVENIKIIGSYAFSGCKDLKKIDIPNTIVRVGSCAFSNCGNLCNVIISEGVKHIDVDAFWGCNQIKTLKLPESYEPEPENEERYWWCGFNKLASLETPVYNSRYFVALPQNFVGKYVVPDGIVEICSSAFKGCAALTEVSLPDSVRTISFGAFAECHALQKVINASKIEKIGKGAFFECKELTEFEIPNSVKIIGNKAFQGCSNLQHVKLPYNLKEVSSGLFKNCARLSGIKLPSSIQKIGHSAFEGCSSLESIIIPNGPEKIEYNTFKNCTRLKYFSIPPSVETIGGGAFEGCFSIEQADMPSGWNKFRMKIGLPPIYNTYNDLGSSDDGPMLNTHGSMRPCPYCGYSGTSTYADGTAQCGSCGRWFRYA